MKQHEKRFIIELKSLSTGRWKRSGNTRLFKFFATREEAHAALTPENCSEGLVYHVRQK